jgi:hypothetical protein
MCSPMNKQLDVCLEELMNVEDYVQVDSPLS